MAQSILKYLKKVQELEGTIYTMDRMTTQLADQALRLGRKQNIELPEPVAVDKVATKAAIVGAIAMAILPIVYFFQAETGYGLGGLLSDLWTIVKMTFYGCLFAGIGGVLGYQIGRQIDKKEEKAINRNKRLDTLARMDQDERRVKKELVIQDKIKAQMRQIKQQRDHVKESLAQLYALNIVHPKYRSLIPITMFCEYMETGRCNSLEGHEGAYNIYEQEVRLDRIATKLDVIIQKLDSIRENQYDLYQLLSQTNSTVSKVLQENQNMVRTLGDIRENTALTAYNSHVAAVNTAAIGDMMVMKELLR